MNIAIIEKGKCVNVATFEDLETAQSMYGENAVELPEGRWIGHKFDGENWNDPDEIYYNIVNPGGKTNLSAEQILNILLGEAE